MPLPLQTSAIIAISFLVLIIISLIYKNRDNVKKQIELALQPYFEEELHHITLADGVGGLVDIERLVLLKQGILLIETLPISGHIFGADKIDTWTQMIHGKSFKFTNPLYRLEILRQAVQLAAPKTPIFCRLIFTAKDSSFPKGKPENVSLLTSLQDDLEALTRSPEITEQQRANWQQIIQVAQSHE